ncbi:MAG TPA: acyltransferase family protein [Chloroflexia bacterium]|nr:acyltransferase family protein [Chloroflexia bacterium]
MLSQSIGTSDKPARNFALDWLRVGAVLLLFPFHTAVIFDIWDAFYVKNNELSRALSYSIIDLFSPWQMSLLFVLAGGASWYALSFRTGGQYLSERFKRLFIPLFFGLVVIVPVQVYYAGFQNPDYNRSFFQFYPSFFTLGPGDLTGFKGNGFTPGHLWFILYLFIFSLIALPLFSWLRRKSGQIFIARLAAICHKPGVIFLPGVILMLIAALPLPDMGGKNPFYFFSLLLIGYLLVADSRFSQELERQRWIALGLAVLTSLGLVMYRLLNLDFSGLSPLSVLHFFLFYFTGWCWVMTFLGFGQRYLNHNHRALQYLNEASYPTYILHLPVVVVIGYYVVQWDLPLLIKFGLIMVAALAVTYLIFELLVRRFNPVRFLFGMKPRSQKPLKSRVKQLV